MEPTASPRGGFTGLLIGQATGAANDNLFRQAFAIAITTVVASEVASNRLKAAMGILFILPFIVAAPIAGRLADRLPKHHLIRGVRVAELGLCILGTAALMSQNSTLMLVTIAAFGLQSALFAPVKYAVLPELVSTDRLAVANARVHALSNIAILVGTGLAAVAEPGMLAGLGGPWAIGVVGMAIALIGVGASWRIPPLPAATNNKPSLGDRRSALWHLRKHDLVVATVGLSGLWATGAVVQVVLTGIAVHNYHLNEAGAALLALILGGGLALGALLAPRWHHRAYPAGLPVLGAVIAGLGSLLAGQAAMAELNLVWFGMWTAVAGIGGGLWAVPLNALIQERCPRTVRGRVIAAVNVCNVIGILLGFGLVTTLGGSLGYTSAGVLAVTGWVALLGAVTFGWCYRQHLAAWLLRQIIRMAYWTRVVNRNHLPDSGGCLVVCNHVSFADGLILAAHLQRPARFLVYHRYFNLPVIGFFLRAAGAIPIHDGGQHRALVAAITTATEAAKNGEVVMIFPEGKLTRSGRMDRFHGGMERIARRSGVPIVPAHLDGLWGAITSHAPRQGLPRPWRPITLRLGAPLPTMTTAAQAQNEVQRLGYASAAEYANNDNRTLGEAVLQQVRSRPGARAVMDANGEMSRLRIAAAALAVIPLLELADDEQKVGVLLPHGRGGSLVNLALALAGKTSVNLNHTAGADGMKKMAELAGVRTVITSSLFMRRLNLEEVPGRAIHAEDLIGKMSKLSVMAKMAKILLCPPSWLSKGRPDDVATIIFSSGSTGEPKGVQLTHRQLLANFKGVADHLTFDTTTDVMLCPLPLFHSFGYSTGLFLPLTTGLPVAAHPDPTDAAGIAKLAKATNTTFLLGTATFVRSWMRRIEPEDFASLNFAVVGAEKCPADLRVQFKERYGAHLLEGYGCTELAPVVSVNALSHEVDGIADQHIREGSVGRPLPGIDVMTIHPETGELLQHGQEGLLVFKSPARMEGYLNRPDLTAQAFVHGGYNTGDVGYVDDDGFIFITGRLARFAKIGGEMVPLENVQEALLTGLHDRLGEHEHNLAVSAVPDKARGERLIVLHDGINLKPQDIVGPAESLPPLFRPRARDVHQVEALPVLGTGKLDLKGLKQLAEEVAT